MALPSFDVTGKAVLITGGTGGIGLAIARAFKGYGAEVVLADLKPPPDAQEFRYLELDVRDPEGVARLPGSLSRLDVLIQCAGRAMQRREYQAEHFDDVLNTNLRGTFRVAVALKPLLAASRGCVINIASMYSYYGSPQAPAYGASKAAIVQLTKSLAIEWSTDGIRVNAIAPGWFITEMSKRARENADYSRKVLDRLPAGQWSDPEEIAGAAIFLASPASRLITGVTLPVDGGYTAV